VGHDANKGGKLRLFYGVFIEAHLHDGIAALQQRLRQAGGRVTWVKPPNLHYTLRFIGDTPPARVAELAQAGRQAAAACRRFSTQVSGVGAFPSPPRARTIWLGAAEGAEQLKALHAALIEALKAANLADPERKPFVPHCTLGRVRERPSAALAATIEANAQAEIGPMECAELCLIKSTLTGSGEVYETLEAFTLPD